MGLQEEYEELRLAELKAKDGTSEGVASVIIEYRPKGSIVDGTKWEAADWWVLALLKADIQPEDPLETFMSTSGFIKKTWGNQKTGQGPVTLKLPLKNITPYAKNLMMGGNNPYVTYDTRYPGTRKIVYTFAGPFTAGTITATYTTTKISDGTTDVITVSEPYAVSDVATGAGIIADIETGNPGILASGTTYATPTLTITAAPGYTIEITTPLAISGGTPTISSVVETDTSIKTTTVVAANGAIDYLSFGVDDASVFVGFKQIFLDTGVDVIRQEEPYIDRLDLVDNVVYLKDGLSQLPADGADVTAVHGFNFPSGGASLPEHLEMRIKYDDHSDRSVDMLYYYNCSLSGKTGPYRGAEGEEGELTFVALTERVLVNGKYIGQSYDYRTNNEVPAGTY